jgi:hypothetical protein
MDVTKAEGRQLEGGVSPKRVMVWEDFIIVLCKLPNPKQGKLRLR